MKIKFIFLAIIIFSSKIFSGLVSPAYKWNTRQVKVCWATNGMNYYDEINKPQKYWIDRLTATHLTSINQFKEIVRKQVSQEYTIGKTGISFVEWANCPKINVYHYYDAILFLDAQLDDDHKGFGGNSAIGNVRYQNILPMINFLYFTGKKTQSKITLEDTIKRTALHEFGHLAGLNHEDDILDYHEKIIREGKNKIVNGYNPFSIMSYQLEKILLHYGPKIRVHDLKDSYPSFYSAIKHTPPSFLQYWEKNERMIAIKNVLSAGDIIALKCLYVFSKDERLENCGY